jgi:hypothetical protein
MHDSEHLGPDKIKEKGNENELQKKAENKATYHLIQTVHSQHLPAESHQRDIRVNDQDPQNAEVMHHAFLLFFLGFLIINEFAIYQAVKVPVNHPNGSAEKEPRPQAVAAGLAVLRLAFATEHAAAGLEGPRVVVSQLDDSVEKSNEGTVGQEDEAV